MYNKPVFTVSFISDGIVYGIYTPSWSVGQKAILPVASNTMDIQEENNARAVIKLVTV